VYLLIVGILIAALFVLYFLGALWFVHHHPGEALLEGAELIRWRQMEIAAKDVTVTPALAANTPAPVLIENQSGDPK
jgi:hypothetical protein